MPPIVSGRRRWFRAAFIAMLFAAFSAAESHAVTYHWDAVSATTAATGGTGNWDIVSSLLRAGSGQGDISFNGVAGYAAISFGGYYEIVAVPEPTSVLGVLGLLALIAYRERRRVRRLWDLHVSPALMFLGFLLVAFVMRDSD